MNTIPIDHVGCNVHETDRFNIDYKLTEAEKKFSFFCILILAFGGLFMMFHWMFDIATR